MAYREFNSRGGRSRGPLHLQIYDAVADLFRNYRIGWLALFLAALYFGNRLLSPSPMAMVPVEDPLRDAPTVADGRALAEAVAAAGREYFWGRARIAGLGDEVAIALNYPKNGPRVASDAQTRAFDHFLAAYPAMREKIGQAMLSAYQAERTMALDTSHVESPVGRGILRAMDLAGMFPDLKTAEAVWERLDDPMLDFYAEEADGLAYVSLQFTPGWTVDPFGVVIHGDRVIWAGTGPDTQWPIIGLDAGLDVDREWLQSPGIQPDFRRPAAVVDDRVNAGDKAAPPEKEE